MNEGFPIQAEGIGSNRAQQTFIPWWLAEVAYKEYTRRYGNRQTLKRLKERGGFGRAELLDLLGYQQTDRTEVKDIKICKLPYQEHPFVHGERNGSDVWLMNNGEWTDVDGHEMADIPLRKGLVITEHSNIKIKEDD